MTEFARVLHVWVASEVIDLTPWVDSGGGQNLFVAKDTGGGSSAHLWIKVDQNAPLILKATLADDRKGPAELHWITTPETGATLDLAESASEEIKGIERLTAAGDYEEARGWLAPIHHHFFAQRLQSARCTSLSASGGTFRSIRFSATCKGRFRAEWIVKHRQKPSWNHWTKNW